LQARSSKASSVNQGEIVLQEAAAHEPGNFDVNHKLGKLLVEEGNLEKRSHISSGLPSSIRAPAQNAYQLTLAYVGSADYQRARALVQALLTTQLREARGNAELHHLLGTSRANWGIRSKLFESINWQLNSIQAN